MNNQLEEEIIINTHKFNTSISISNLFAQIGNRDLITSRLIPETRVNNNEIERYLANSYAADIPELEWWKSNYRKYPKIANQQETYQFTFLKINEITQN